MSFDQLKAEIEGKSKHGEVWQARREALRLLIKTGHFDAVNIVSTVLLTDTNSSVRLRAAVVLGESKMPAAIPALIKAVQIDWDSGVRSQAIKSLAEMEINDLHEVFSAIIEAEKKDYRRQVRLEATKAIEKFSNKKQMSVAEFKSKYA